MSCHIDEHYLDRVYANCVLDFGKPEDCKKTYSGKIAQKEQCEFWSDLIGKEKGNENEPIR